MRALLLLILPLALIVCPLAQYLAPEAPPPTSVPTLTPTIARPSARIDLTTSATSLRVGETVTLTGKAVGIGIPYYTLTLSSGASVTVTNDNQVREALGENAQFEMVSASGSMNEVIFVLRALAPGTVDVTLSATGEVVSAEGAYSWGYAGAAPVTLAITE